MGTRMTSKGQVTIPKRIRNEMGFEPGDEFDFVREDGRLEVRKAVEESPFDRYYGYLKGQLRGKRTDEIIREMRGE